MKLTKRQINKLASTTLILLVSVAGWFMQSKGYGKSAKDPNSLTSKVSVSASIDSITSAPAPSTQQGETATVSRVIDGDTIEVTLDGQDAQHITTAKIRLIGINTPESVDPRKAVECFGKEAAAYTKQLVDGAQVQLLTDSSQGDKDKYDRLLRYVYKENEFINKKLIEDGYAYEYTYNTPYQFQTEFKAAQEDARQNKRGLWSPTTCNGNN